MNGLFMMSLRSLWLKLILFTLAGCASIQLQSGYDQGFDFARLRSWDWAPQSGVLKTLAAIQTSERIRLDSLVRRLVESRLKEKGYVRQRGHADFLVAWSFGEWQLERHSRPGGGYGAVGLAFPGLHGSLIPESKDGRALPPSANPYSSSYEQAKLEFVVIDSKTERIVWNATVVDDSDFGYYTSAQKDRIRAAVDQILSGFPPVP